MLLKTGEKRSNDQILNNTANRKKLCWYTTPSSHANLQCSCSNSNNCNKKQLCPLFGHSWDKNVLDSISHWGGNQQPASPQFNDKFYQLQQANRISLNLPLTLIKQEQKSSASRAETRQANKISTNQIRLKKKKYFHCPHEQVFTDKNPHFCSPVLFHPFWVFLQCVRFWNQIEFSFNQK